MRLRRLWRRGRRLWPGGLFWRSFLLLVVLIAASLAIWFQTFRVVERTPRAYQLAQQIVSIVNVTRAALVYAEVDKRVPLIRDLLDNEGIRIYPLEENDNIEGFRDSSLARMIAQRVREQLGGDTRIAARVNGKPGIWVSFTIDDDHYWAFMERERLERVYGQQWVGWTGIAALLSVFGAVMIVRFVNRPLNRLAGVAEAMASGATPDRLPEKGPAELRTVNASFNRMVDELARLEDDRALMLAGISHDLRTPLSRLRLEIEMSGLAPDTKAAIEGDVEQMDRIIGQFMHYGRAAAGNAGGTQSADLADLVEEAASAYQRPEPDGGAECVLELAIEARPQVWCNPTDLKRVVANLLENARRYGHAPDEPARIELTLDADPQCAFIRVRDFGPGIEAPERLLRPFVRGEGARSDATGAGLGLAIVDRIVRNQGGRFTLGNAPGGGTLATIALPLTMMGLAKTN
jgi:two-component system osmolarity sensor histidine kinase EnvZ